MSFLNKHKIGFIGCGNLAQSILSSLLTHKVVKPDNIYFTNRSKVKADKIINDYSINYIIGNDELIDLCDVVIIAVKPQDFFQGIEPYVANFRENQIVISLAAGIGYTELCSLISTTNQIVRVMTNTAASVSSGVVGYIHSLESKNLDSLVETLFTSIGDVYKLSNEEEFSAFTVATSSGIGFVFEIMTYWAEWLEQYGIPKDVAERMITQTLIGATQLSKLNKVSLTDLQNKVVSKKGVTLAGLESMREMELDRLFRVSFEKAVMRDKELGETISP